MIRGGVARVDRTRSVLLLPLKNFLNGRLYWAFFSWPSVMQPDYPRNRGAVERRGEARFSRLTL